MRRKDFIIHASDNDLASIALIRLGDVRSNLDKICTQIAYMQTDIDKAFRADNVLEILDGEFDDAVMSLKEILKLIAAWDPQEEYEMKEKEK